MAGEVPQQQAKVATVKSHRNPDPAPLAMETNAEAMTMNDVKGGATIKDSSPYSLEGAMDGLLEVAGAMPTHSPQRQKKTTNTGMEEATAM